MIELDKFSDHKNGSVLNCERFFRNEGRDFSNPYSRSTAKGVCEFNPKELAEERVAFAGVCTQEGKYEISAQLLGSANALLNKTGGSWWLADRMDIEPNREISRNNLDGEVFESAWEVGQGMELSTVFELVETIQQLFASTYWSINCQLSLFYTLNGSI